MLSCHSFYEALEQILTLSSWSNFKLTGKEVGNQVAGPEEMKSISVSSSSTLTFPVLQDSGIIELFVSVQSTVIDRLTLAELRSRIQAACFLLRCMQVTTVFV